VSQIWGQLHTLTGVFDSETQASALKVLRESGDKRDLLTISSAHIVRWVKCQGDELGVDVPPRRLKITYTSAQRPECHDFAPSVVTLSGRLVSHTFAGPPGYSDVSKGDTPEVVLVLNLAKPVCTNESTVSQEYWQPATQVWTPGVEKHPELNGVSQLQLVVTDQKVIDRCRALLSRDVTIRGSLVNAETGHHHTPLLLMVSGIEQPPPAVKQ